ncbi:hypothetical protein [Streptomyces sp. NPDC056669]|uniref:hypothetical protein n=1 Tax=unclassified Streptomyces TaxID=2593676 RepID=UPI003646887C
MRDARDQRADDNGELVLTEQERTLLAEIAAMTERLRGELEEIRAEVAEIQEGRSMEIYTHVPSEATRKALRRLGKHLGKQDRK